eukprot:4232451-Amphidinium_carterae.1
MDKRMDRHCCIPFGNHAPPPWLQHPSEINHDNLYHCSTVTYPIRGAISGAYVKKQKEYMKGCPGFEYEQASFRL